MWWKKKLNQIDENFVRKGAEKVTDKDLILAVESEEKAYQRINKSGILKKYLQIIRLMFSMLNDYRKGVYINVPWLTIGALVFILLYFINPLDLIPDFIPLIGYLDDVTVLVFGLNLIETDLNNYLKWKAKTQSPVK